MVKGLGRLISPDTRDNNYPLKALLPKKASTRIRRFWRSSTYWGDQGNTGQCVAYAWVHYIHHGPLSMPGKTPVINPVLVYNSAQLIDEWPGESPVYEGTSVRAGVEVLKRLGFVASYYWTGNIYDLTQAILNLGPVVVGTDWLAGMYNPQPDGFIHAVGWPQGGHAWLVTGVDTKLRYFRGKNSWGRDWADKGNFYISFDDMEYLLNKPFAEVCIAVESRNK